MMAHTIECDRTDCWCHDEVALETGSEYVQGYVDGRDSQHAVDRREPTKMNFGLSLCGRWVRLYPSYSKPEAFNPNLELMSPPCGICTRIYNRRMRVKALRDKGIGDMGR